jgi:hypothetical protein
MTSFPPEPGIPLSPRARRLVQQIATIVALACFLSLLMLRAGGAAPPPAIAAAPAAQPSTP